MVKLYEGGAYLYQGMEVIPDGAEAGALLKSKTGKEIVKDRESREPCGEECS